MKTAALALGAIIILILILDAAIYYLKASRRDMKHKKDESFLKWL